MGGPLGTTPKTPKRLSLTKGVNQVYDLFNSKTLPTFNDYFKNQPLLNNSATAAQAGLDQLPYYQAEYQKYKDQLGPLNSQYAGLFGQIPGLTSQLQGYASQIPGLQNQYKNEANALNPLNAAYGQDIRQLGGISRQLGATRAPIQDIIGQYKPILDSHGAITDPGQLERLQQQSQALFAARGNNYGNQSIAQDILNRSEAEQARMANASGQIQGATGQLTGISNAQAGIAGEQAGITGQQAGLVNQRAGITGQQAGLLNLGAGLTGQQGNLLNLGAGLTGQQAGLVSQGAGITGLQQAATGQAINPALAAQQAAEGGFGSLINPLLNYNQDINNTNFNAQAAAGINAANKNSGLLGGGISALGNIGGSYFGG